MAIKFVIKHHKNKSAKYYNTTGAETKHTDLIKQISKEVVKVPSPPPQRTTILY
jgi:hypothetical protein